MEAFKFLDASLIDSEDYLTIERLKANLCELDRFLGPFPFDGDSGEIVSGFSQLSGFIDSDLLDRVFGNEEAQFDQMTASYHSSTPDSEHSFHFTKILPNKEIIKTHPNSLHDKSQVVTDLCPLNGLLGEVQLCYLIFVLGQNFEGFAQWISIIELLSQCSVLLYTEHHFFSVFLKILSKQLDAESTFCQRVDLGELFGLASSDGNRLKKALRSLVQEATQQRESESLSRAATELDNLLQTQYRGDFGFILPHKDADDEDSPTMVDLI